MIVIVFVVARTKSVVCVDQEWFWFLVMLLLVQHRITLGSLLQILLFISCIFKSLLFLFWWLIRNISSHNWSMKWRYFWRPQVTIDRNNWIFERSDELAINHLPNILFILILVFLEPQSKWWRLLHKIAFYGFNELGVVTIKAIHNITSVDCFQFAYRVLFQHVLRNVILGRVAK